MKAQSPEIKICGLRTPEDARILNACGADYAGFVFHAPSKRNISYEEARSIMDALDPSIRRVAVVVSPTPERVREIRQLPFDIIQIHGSCPPETLEAIRIPIWRAVNIANIDELTVSAAEEGMERISGILVDAKEYGSGKTFDWAAAEQISEAVRRLCAAIEENRRCGGISGSIEDARCGGISGGIKDARRRGTSGSIEDARCGGISGGIETYGLHNTDADLSDHVKFILAGGLHAGNVSEGIRLFSPDVVDVSSGVEYDARPGKDPQKVQAFTKTIRSDAAAASAL